MNESKRLLRVPWDTTIRTHVSCSREKTYTLRVWHANNVRHLSMNTLKKFYPKRRSKVFWKTLSFANISCGRIWKWNISEIILQGNQMVGAILFAAPHYSSWNLQRLAVDQKPIIQWIMPFLRWLISYKWSRNSPLFLKEADGWTPFTADQHWTLTCPRHSSPRT